MKAKELGVPGLDPREQAIDTLGALLRSMAEFALQQEHTDTDTFRKLAEAWAQHVLLAAPVPGVPSTVAPRPATGGRRDWEGVRRFVHEYCRSSSSHNANVAGDLREVIWVFVRNFTQSFSAEEATDERLQEQLARLERLVDASDVAQLKREMLDTVGTLTQELGERRERQRAQMATLGETVRALGDELASARKDGETDPLTRLFNRKALDAYVEESVQMFGAFRQDTCLLLVDIDHFKSINDASGHLVGDDVLRQVADALARVFLRKSDFVARYGGDELAVVLREASLGDAARLAERVLSRVRMLRIPAGDRHVGVTVSIGAAALGREDDAKRWFERADRGLYAAKAAGRDAFAAGGDAVLGGDSSPPSPPRVKE